MCETKCYRIWFTDDSAILVDAKNLKHAKSEAKRLTHDCRTIDYAECLNDDNPETAKVKKIHDPIGCFICNLDGTSRETEA